MNPKAQIGPKDALCALFLMIRETGRPQLVDLAARLGIGRARLVPIVRALRDQGLVQDEVLSLTFVGLATAASLLPTSRIRQDESNFIAAA